MSARRGEVAWESVQQFLGLDTEAHPAARAEGLLQVDEGSSHERRGVWQPRRGWEHTGVSKKAAAISALVTLQLPDGDYVAVVCSGQNMDSEASFDQ